VQSSPSDWRARLLEWRNADGGWGYSPGKRSRLEPTCLALLALDRTDAGERAAARAVLARWPARGALLVDGSDLPINYAFNGLALLAWTGLGGAARDAFVQRATGPLTAAKGLALEPSEAVRVDSRLQAWPWIDGTFSWVEPTAWCLLALKKCAAASPGVASRVGEAERLLLDRACQGGGWNYGNAMVFATPLPAYPSTTAIALLSLQDKPALPAVKQGLAFLPQAARSEPSALATGLGVVALEVFAQPADDLDDLLRQRLAIAGSLEQVVGVAAALYALDRKKHGCAAFRL